MSPSIILAFLLSFPSRADLAYTPKNLNPATAKIVVVIHGCLQSAETLAAGTGWNRIADKENLAIYYPQVPESSHDLDCWSWFLPENQKANSGQLKQIMDGLQDFRRAHNLARAPMYLTGISSGAVTAAGLLSCFPTAFAGAALHSGPPYGYVSNEREGKRLLTQGPDTFQARTDRCSPTTYAGKLIVLHGSSDNVVNNKNALGVIQDFFGKDLTAARSRQNENGSGYTITDFSKNGQTKARLVMVDELTHAWSGFNLNLPHPDLLAPGKAFPTNLPFFAPLGPSATNLIWEYWSR